MAWWLHRQRWRLMGRQDRTRAVIAIEFRDEFCIVQNFGCRGNSFGR
jgi:hypothetical protein